MVMEVGCGTYSFSPDSLRIMSGAVVSCPMRSLLSWPYLPTRLYTCTLCKRANIEKKGFDKSDLLYQIWLVLSNFLILLLCKHSVWLVLISNSTYGFYLQLTVCMAFTYI